jgi:hypothetical protein
MRWLLAICVAACGGDRATSLEEPLGDASQALEDGAAAADAPTPGDAPPHDGAPPIDSLPATVCEEAALHSDLAWIEANVFVPRCSECHGGASPDAGLRLEIGHSRNQLVNIPSSTKGSPWVRVAPGSVANSYLMVALNRTPGPASSLGFMPLGSAPLCDPILDAIERWIVAGAQ